MRIKAIGPFQHQIVEALRQCGEAGVTRAELAKRIGAQGNSDTVRSNILKATYSLIRRGLVREVPNPAHGRRPRVALVDVAEARR